MKLQMESGALRALKSAFDSGPTRLFRNFLTQPIHFTIGIGGLGEEMVPLGAQSRSVTQSGTRALVSG